MKGVKRINNNPAEQTVRNFMAATNAVAEQDVKNGKKAEFLSAANAKEVYIKTLKSIVAFANPSSEKHNMAFNALREQVNRNPETMNDLESMGHKLIGSISMMAESFQKHGMTAEAAVESAYNSLAGNPVFDHFGNLNVLAAQMFENMAFVENFIKEGDAFALPVESGSTNTDKSRFRAPTEQVTGSAKTKQGDINPIDHIRDDANRIQINLINEFKNAKTLEAVFSITQDQRNQALGYAESIAPALAGFILQNRYFEASQKHVMKLAELEFVDGMDSSGSYTPGVGGSYGILSPSIQLGLSDYNTIAPTVAQGSDWSANPTKLIQKITNFNFVPITVAGQLPTNVDPKLMYLDIIRLANLAAQQNIDWKPRKWTLYVPTTWYALAMQYPGTGTFNKQLNEMVLAATNGIINNIEIVPSSLMNYRAANSYGSTAAAYNYMALIAHGSENEKKPIIMPGQTAVPYVVSENVSASIMNFRTQYIFGGPMFMHFGGAFLMEFSRAS